MFSMVQKYFAIPLKNISSEIKHFATELEDVATVLNNMATVLKVCILRHRSTLVQCYSKITVPSVLTYEAKHMS